MAQTYTLEEASQRLGISSEEFKRRLRDDWKQVRSFRDGATLRFRAADIDDLARAAGQASDPGLTLGASGSALSDSSEEIPLLPPKKSGKGKEEPLFLDDDSDDILALPDTKGKKAKGDSDVRLDLTPSKADRNAKQPTEELELPLPGPTSGVGLGKSSSKLTNPKSSGRLNPPSASKIPTPVDSASDDGSSEFELSLDASDSDSFELKLNDSSEEVPLGELPASPNGASGINLGRPKDSGVSIEKKRPPADDDSDIDFELSADAGGPKSGRTMAANVDDGSSEFELTLDDSSGSESMNALASSVQPSDQIYETDFELPVVADDDSGSEVVSLDDSDTDLENSDFDLAIDGDAVADEDSASEVVMVDGEDDDSAPAAVVAAPGKSGRRSDFAGIDDDDDRPVSRRGASLNDAPVRTVAAAPPKWGPVPAILLGLTFPLVVLGGIMSYELVRGMAGYQAPNSASAPLVRGVAKMFGLSAGD
jgi:hypothetical protein